MVLCAGIAHEERKEGVHGKGPLLSLCVKLCCDAAAAMPPLRIEVERKKEVGRIAPVSAIRYRRVVETQRSTDKMMQAGAPE